MYAIIEEGGRQYKVTSGDTILIDREAGDDKSITFDRVLMVGGDGGAGDEGRADARGAFAADQEHAVEGDRLLVAVERPVDQDGVATGDPVLPAALFDDRVHGAEFSKSS